MQSVGELVGAGLVAYMFFNLTDPGVKNSGVLDLGSSDPQPVADPLETDEGKLYADAEGIESRSPDDVCR
eukprot:7391402-Prymnesium_polylepis.2